MLRETITKKGFYEEKNTVLTHVTETVVLWTLIN